MSEENKNLNIETAAEEIASEVKKAKKKSGKKTEKSKSDKSEKGGIKEFLKSRKAKSGAVATAIVAVFIAVIIVINIIAGLLVEKFPDIVFDFTANSAYSLQEDTVDYVSHLGKTVNIKVLMDEKTFESQGTYFVQSQKLLEKMQSNSNGKLKLEYVDLTANPTFTSAYPNVDWLSSESNYMVLVECGKQYKVLTLEDCIEYSIDYYGSYSFTGTKIEQAVITAILNVTTEDKVIVDMITGNQEQDYTAIKKLLEDNAYEVHEVSLATSGLDKDAAIAISYAPSVDFDAAATAKLSEWLNNDGKYGKTLMYVSTADKPETPNLDDFLSVWGMKINNGYVYETNMEKLVSGSTLFAFITDYTDKYKENLKNSQIPVIVSDSHNIEITDDSVASSLLVTSDKAGVRPYEIDDNWQLEDGITGEPLVIGAEGVVNNEDEVPSRVIVFGSYMIFSEQIMQLNSCNNSGYLMNIVNTVSGNSDAGITIESTKIENNELGITDVAAQNMMLIIFVIVIPVAILIAGIAVWLRRRNK